jgi:hypothetical protein
MPSDARVLLRSPGAGCTWAPPLPLPDPASHGRPSPTLRAAGGLLYAESSANVSAGPGELSVSAVRDGQAGPPLALAEGPFALDNGRTYGEYMGLAACPGGSDVVALAGHGGSIAAEACRVAEVAHG